MVVILKTGDGRKWRTRILVAVLVAIPCSDAARAHGDMKIDRGSTSRRVGARRANCEDYARVVDDWLAEGPSASLITIVARPGSRDSDRKWTGRRAHNVRQYLLDRGVARDRIAISPGPVSRGYGLVTLVADGMKNVELEVDADRDIPLTWHCEPENTQYYPRHDIWLRQRPGASFKSDLDEIRRPHVPPGIVLSD